MEGKMSSLTLSGELPGPRGPHPPESREPLGPESQERPTFLALLPGIQKPGEFCRETRRQAPGGRLRAQWSPRRVRRLPRTPAAPAHSPASAFVPQACPGGKTTLTPALDPEEVSARPSRARPRVAPGRIRRGLGWEVRLQDQPPSSARRLRASRLAPPGAQGPLMSVMLIMVQLLKGWGTGNEDSTPTAAQAFDG